MSNANDAHTGPNEDATPAPSSAEEPRKVLILKRRYPQPVLKDRFRHLPDDLDVDLLRLDKDEQTRLGARLAALGPERYDRVVLDLKWRLLRKQGPYLRALSNLVIVGHDCWFNFEPHNRHYKRFEHFYHALPPIP